MAAGYTGMTIATIANAKCTYLCNGNPKDNWDGEKALAAGFGVAFQGGQTLGFCLVGLALVLLNLIILLYKSHVIVSSTNFAVTQASARLLFEFVSGYGLGGSMVALFARVGGGIYTKAADVGSDIAGKVHAGLKEDSPKNPGTIADNVGDNVGDIAGMGADLFGSLAESTCAALVVSTSSAILLKTPAAIFFPMLVTSAGIISSMLTIPFAYLLPGTVETKLKLQLIISTLILSCLLIPLILKVLPD
jgi:inorganic pyrophosphatase